MLLRTFYAFTTGQKSHCTLTRFCKTFALSRSAAKRCLTLKQLCKENRRALLSCLNLLCSHFTNKAKVVETVSRLLILYLSVSRLLLLCLHLNWITCLRLVPLFYFAKHVIYRRGYSQAYGIHLPVVSRSSWLLPWRDACVLSMPLRARTPCCISVVNIQAPE